MGGLKRRKQLKRLARRKAAYPGPYPTTNNPGKEGGPGTGHELHPPGSNRK